MLRNLQKTAVTECSMFRRYICIHDFTTHMAISNAIIVNSASQVRWFGLQWRNIRKKFRKNTE